MFFLLNTLFKECVLGKDFPTLLRNFAPKFVAMLLVKGGLNNVILRFLFLLIFALTLVTFE